jgi:hypothetical protein
MCENARTRQHDPFEFVHPVEIRPFCGFPLELSPSSEGGGRHELCVIKPVNTYIDTWLSYEFVKICSLSAVTFNRGVYIS